MAHSRPPFQGSKRHLVLGLDLGTTFSGVSYAIQDPGKQVTTQAVTRFPGQDKGSASIPTVIYYSKKGKILGVGAEDPSEDSDVDIVKVEWFKMLLRPKGSAIPLHDDVPSPQLPPGKDIVDVYADFYKYLFDCTKAYVAQTHESGSMFWDSLGEGGITFVLSHPNGWGGSQQAIMRRAIVKANLLSSDDEAQERVCFVPEGEASLHFCLDSERGPSDLKAGNTVMVIDAGGGTVDISTYTFVSTSPVHIKEATSPSCKFEGAVIVSQRARKHLSKKLAKSKFGTDEYLDAIVNEFDTVSKKRFKDAGADPINIKFSRMLNDHDPKVAIRAGKIKLSGAEVKGFFDPGVSVIIQAIEDQRLAIDPREVKIYFLVGGFASNEYLFSKIKDHLETNDLILLRPDCESKKAVAEGAVSYYLDHYVKSRMAKFTYGTSCGTPFIPFLPSHRKRMRDVVPDLDGGLMLFGAFSNVLRQGTQVEETTEFRQSYFAQGIHKKEKVEMELMLYRGHGEPPEFIDDDEASFPVLCTVSADLKDAPAIMSFGPLGPYFVQKVDLVFAFGLTELKAQLAWEDENGNEQRTHATPIYEDDFMNSSASSAVARTAGPSRS